MFKSAAQLAKRRRGAVEEVTLSDVDSDTDSDDERLTSMALSERRAGRGGPVKAPARRLPPTPPPASSSDDDSEDDADVVLLSDSDSDEAPQPAQATRRSGRSRRNNVRLSGYALPPAPSPPPPAPAPAPSPPPESPGAKAARRAAKAVAAQAERRAARRRERQQQQARQAAASAPDSDSDELELLPEEMFQPAPKKARLDGDGLAAGAQAQAAVMLMEAQMAEEATEQEAAALARARLRSLEQSASPPPVALLDAAAAASVAAAEEAAAAARAAADGPPVRIVTMANDSVVAKFRLGRQMPFSKLRDAFCKRYACPAGRVKLMLNGAKLPLGKTPLSVGADLDRVVTIHAELPDEFLAEAREAQRAAMTAADGPAEGAGAGAGAAQAQAQAAAEDGLIAVTAQWGRRRDERLDVRVPAGGSFGDVARAFAAARGVSEHSVSVKLDGETMPAGRALEEEDVEEGDVVDVVVRGPTS